MTDQLLIDAHRLYREDGRRFDPWQLRWQEGDPPGSDAQPIAPADAVRRLFARREGRQLPVAIIGPREPNPQALGDAESVAEALAELGFALICGGRGGAMEAASRGCARVGGLMIGILPSDDWREANDHVAIPIATGIGEARNAVIATAAFALVSVGGRSDPVSYGTISEMAFGLRHSRLVIAMPDAPDLPGVQHCATATEAVARVVRRYLALD
jgi:uncharacterized protein (TIGR00725 family)